MIKHIINRPVLVTMLLVGLSLLGGVSYYQMPVEFQPYVELPLLIVQVGTARDADPSYVEKNGVIPVEQAIAGMEDVEDIESSIDRRRAVIFVYYQQDTDLKYAYLKLREKLRDTQNSMETGFYINVWKVDTEQLANQFMTLQALGEGSLDQIREVVDSRVLPELENIDGVANVEVFGGKRRSISVILDEGALKSHNLTASRIESKLTEGNASRQFLGTVIDGQKQTFVNLAADYTSLSRISETVIKEEGPVLLRHLARIIDGGAEEESIARVNGKEAIQIVLIREQSSNLLALSDQARATIDEINKRTAHTGVQLIVQSDSADAIDDSIGMIKKLGLIGGLLAVLVLWVFLRNIRLVLIVALALPMSIIIAMNFIAAAGITINSLSLMGIAIAVGMLLDNSIVVLENIYRQMARGMTPYQAVTSGTAEVSRAIIAATLTTVCVFLPFIYSGNFLTLMIGRNIGLAIISTLLVSLAVAFLLIPAFTYFFLTRKSLTVESFNQVRQKNRLLQIYTLLLKSCLRFPARTTVIAVVAFFLSIAIAIAVSINVSEELEETEFNLYAIMPSGTTLKSADEQVIEMDSRLEEIGELEERNVNITEDNVVFRFVLKEDFEDIAGRNLAGVKDMIVDELDKAFPLVDFSYQQPTTDSRYRGGGGGGRGRGAAGLNRMLGLGSSEEMVVLRGQNLSLLLDVADDIQFNLDNLGTIRRTSISIASRQREIHLMFDWAAMHHFGVTTQSLISELSNFQSEVSSGITLDYGTEKIDVVLTQENLEEKQSDDLRELAIPALGGGTIPLSQLAQLLYTNGHTNIDRVNQEKQVEVRYRFERDINDTKQMLDAARLEVEEIVADINIPDGIGIEVLHDETDLSEYYILILAAMILIYMILASVFESLLTPISMMFTLPLASIGALWGLILTGNTLFSANSLVGILILMGVVVNNGIILIDYSRILRKNGYRRTRALLTAGQARVRPILITASTTVLAMLPLAMGKSDYVAQMGAPFAITVIGGMTVGTLFTLLLIPTAAFGLENAMAWFRSLKTSTKLIQSAFFVVGVWLIYEEVDAVLWQTANVVALFGLIPSLTWFIQTSLRRGRASLIPKGETITISIRNVVKDYDGFSRFTREWRKAERQQANATEAMAVRSGNPWSDLLWRGPLIIFHFYFAYLHLESGIWTVMFTAGFYMHFLSFLSNLGQQIEPGRFTQLQRIGYKLIYWFGPAFNLGWYYLSWDHLGAVIVPFLIWYPAIIIYATATKLHRTGLNVARVKGRFARLRRLWYRLVLAIPILGKRKKPFKALNQVSLEIGSGMFGLVGPNGAGKTTLMRIICGILEQSRGKVTINGIDINEKREELQALIGYLPQEFGTYENMTAESFLDYQALLKGLWNHNYRKQTVDRAISSVHLNDARDRKIKTFSGGMRQRVGIAQTLLHLPRILVVDEPTAGLDPRERIRFRNLLTDLARDRIVIFSTHIIEDISSSCNRLAVMNNGEIQFIGSPRELVNLTEGRVWQVEMDEDMFEKIRTEMKVVHHMNDKGRIRVRILAADKPLENALPVRPTLEDSYLWLLADNKERSNGAIA